MLEFLGEPLAYEFMQRAFVVAVAAGVVCALLSCWLIHVGWSLMGDAISHAVLPGIVLAYLVGIPYVVGALVFAFLAVVLIGSVRSTTVLKEDTVMGTVFTALFAVGVVLLSLYPSQVDVHHVLFGNILGMTRSDAVQVVVIALVVAVLLVGARRTVTLWAFDPGFAAAVGVNVRVVRWVVLFMLALTTVAGVQAVGVVLVVALLITPGATALLWTRRFHHMLWIAPVVAVSSGVLGLYASYWWDVSSGAAIVLLLSAHCAVAWVAGPRQFLRARISARRRNPVGAAGRAAVSAAVRSQQ